MKRSAYLYLKRIAIAALLGFSLVSPSFALAQSELVFPQPVGYVNDFADFLRSETEGFLDAKLEAFQMETGHEIVVVITDSLQGTYIEDLAVRWFERWGIGKEHADNGILMLIVPSEHVMRIEVGYGLEGAVPDSIAQQVGDNVVTPEFRADDPDAGVTAGVEALMKLTQGEDVSALLNPNANSEAQMGLVFFVIMIFIFAWVVYDRIAGVKKIQPFMRKQGARGVFVGVLSVVGGFIAALSGFLHPLAWAGIFAATVGALIFYLTKDAGKHRGGGSGGGWYSSGDGFGGGGGSFGGFGGGSSGGGGGTSRW